MPCGKTKNITRRKAYLSESKMPLCTKIKAPSYVVQISDTKGSQKFACARAKLIVWQEG